MDSVYTPAEDSYLLARHVERLVSGSVLDVGTGSGIQAIVAARKPEVTRVMAVDVNPTALTAASRRAKEEDVPDKITFRESDIFSSVIGSFDWILFNPPYLPSEAGISDLTWDGGGDGGEVVERFLRDAPDHLKEGGSILLVYSSLTQIGGEYGYDWKILEEEHLFFETLYCAQLKKLSPS